MHALTIGRLAKQAGVGVDTVRFYERQGLLPRAQRTVSGYRLYGLEDADRLRFIRRAKELGFTLEEIAQLMSLSQQRESGVKGVKASAKAKLEVVEEKLRELKRVRQGLQKLISACPGHGRLDQCPIIAALSKPDRP